MEETFVTRLVEKILPDGSLYEGEIQINGVKHG